MRQKALKIVDVCQKPIRVHLLSAWNSSISIFLIRSSHVKFPLRRANLLVRRAD